MQHRKEQRRAAPIERSINSPPFTFNCLMVPGGTAARVAQYGQPGPAGASRRNGLRTGYKAVKLLSAKYLPWRGESYSSSATNPISGSSPHRSQVIRTNPGVSPNTPATLSSPASNRSPVSVQPAL
jgi:hypothetical protein